MTISKKQLLKQAQVKAATALTLLAESDQHAVLDYLNDVATIKKHASKQQKN